MLKRIGWKLYFKIHRVGCITIFIIIYFNTTHLHGQNPSRSFELRYYTPDPRANGETDFKGEKEFLNTEQASECKLAYLAAISFVDAQVGRLIDAVKSLGLSNNTIIVFWSDHGFQLGEHGLWFKQSLFEEASKSPLIICVPGTKSAGQICHRNVELVDIYPTLADLQGYSLYSLLQNPEAKWKHAAYTQVQRGKIPGHSVRTEKWWFTEWDYGKMGTELYDEVKDPQEFNNLAADSKYDNVVKKMKELLHKNHPKPVTGGKSATDTNNRYSN